MINGREFDDRCVFRAIPIMWLRKRSDRRELAEKASNRACVPPNDFVVLGFARQKGSSVQ
jgi:hypothetical protein